MGDKKDRVQRILNIKDIYYFIKIHKKNQRQYMKRGNKTTQELLPVFSDAGSRYLESVEIQNYNGIIKK